MATGDFGDDPVILRKLHGVVTDIEIGDDFRRYYVVKYMKPDGGYFQIPGKDGKLVDFKDDVPHRALTLSTGDPPQEALKIGNTITLVVYKPSIRREPQYMVGIETEFASVLSNEASTGGF